MTSPDASRRGEEANEHAMRMMPARIDLRRSRGFGEIITITFAFVRENFRLLGRSLFYIVGPPVLVAGLLIEWVSQPLLGGDVYQPYHVGSRMGLILLSTLFFWGSSILLAAVVNGYIFLYMERGKDGFGISDVWEETRRNFGTVFTTSFGIIAISLVLFLPAVFLGGMLALMGLSLVVALVWIIAGVYFIGVLTPLFTLRLYEDVTLGTAISRCREMVRGHWWETFGILAVTTIVSLVIGVVAGLPTYVIAIGRQFDPEAFDLTGAALAASEAFSVLQTVAGTLLYAIPAVAAAFQYFNLVEKLDGVGMMLRIENIGGAGRGLEDAPVSHEMAGE